MKIYHNPACSKSRRALALIREAGREPEVIEYLKVGWSREGLRALFAQMGVRAHEVLRGGQLTAELGLLEPSRTEEELIEAMVAHPELVERPIVVTARGARVARPPETVLDLL